jgi:hypothetical protein
MLFQKDIQQPNKKQVIFFPQNKLNFFHRFSAVNYDSRLSFFPARQVSEIILNESSKSTENALLSDYKKIQNISQIQSIRGFFLKTLSKLLRARDQSYP